MERFAGKVAVVTGASAGIGLEITKLLLKHGLLVVGLARHSPALEVNFVFSGYPRKL